MGSHSVTCTREANTPRFNPASKADTRFTYSRGMEGWVDLGDLITHQPGIQPATTWSKVRHPNHCTTVFFVTSSVWCVGAAQHYAIRCGYYDRAATIGAVLQVYSGSTGRAMVFCERKRDADELALSSDIRQETHVIHGDISQDKRDMVLKVNYLGTNFQQDLKNLSLCTYCLIGSLKSVKNRNISIDFITHLNINFYRKHTQSTVLLQQVVYLFVRNVGVFKSNLFNKRNTRPLALQYKQYSVNSINSTRTILTT